MEKVTKKTSWTEYLFLHLTLLIYVASNIISKIASTKPLFSLDFIIFYGLVLFLLFVYAFAWQQILKRMSLVKAFSNKAITIFWGMILGYVFYQEPIKWNMIIGAVIIFAGILVVVSDDE